MPHQRFIPQTVDGILLVEQRLLRIRDEIVVFAGHGLDEGRSPALHVTGQRGSDLGVRRVHSLLKRLRGQSRIQRAQLGQKVLAIFRLVKQHAFDDDDNIRGNRIQRGVRIMSGKHQRVGKIAHGALDRPIFNLIENDVALHIQIAEESVYRRPIQKALGIQQRVQRLPIRFKRQVQRLELLQRAGDARRVAAEGVRVHIGYVERGGAVQPLKAGNGVRDILAPGVQAAVIAVDVHLHRLLRAHRHRNGTLRHQAGAGRAEQLGAQRVAAIVIQDKAHIRALDIQAPLRQFSFLAVHGRCVQAQPGREGVLLPVPCYCDLRVHGLLMGKGRAGRIGDGNHRQGLLLLRHRGQRAQQQDLYPAKEYLLLSDE